MTMLPSFWPQIDSDEYKLIPVRTGERWLTLFKVFPDADPLSAEQEAKVIGMGFQKGSQGRYILPSLISEEQSAYLCRLFRVEPGILDPDKVTYLQGGPAVQSGLPLEVRDGIAWWWANDRRALLNEIRITLAASENAEYTEWRDRLTPEQWRNPDRLKSWIASALEGEISPVTEPVIGMGLARALSQYQDDVPPDLAEWQDRLTAFRGDTVKHVTLSEPEGEPARPEARPKAGVFIRWQKDSGEWVGGRVTSHSLEDREALWALPENPNYQHGILMPARERVMLSQIEGYEPAAAQPITNAKFKAPSSQSKWVRHNLTREDIPSADIRDLVRNNSLTPAAVERVSIIARTRGMGGRHPLGFDASYMEPDELVDHWLSISDHIPRDGGKDSPEIRDAQALVRDILLEDFNAAQPEWPEDREPLLAVIPYPTTSSPARMMAMKDVHSRIAQETIYGIGLHPKLISRLEDKFSEWVSNAHPGSKDPFSSAVQHFIKPMFHRELPLDGLIIGRKALGARRMMILLQEMGQEADRSEYVQEITSGLAFATPEDAGKVLIDRFVHGTGLSEETVSANDRSLASIATLSGQSRQFVEHVEHPMFIILDELQKAGAIPSWPRAQALAAFGIDLRKMPMLAGQVGAMCGIKVRNTHTEHLLKTEGGRSSSYGLVTSCVFDRLDGKHAFTFGIASSEANPSQSHWSSPTFGQGMVLVGSEDQEGQRPSGGEANIKSIGLLAELQAVNDLTLSTLPDDEVLTVENISEMEPTWYSVSGNVYDIDLSPSAPDQSLSKNGLKAETDGVGALTKAGAQEAGWIEAAGKTQQALMHMASQDWRNDESEREKLVASVRAWALQNKAYQKLWEGAQEKIVGYIMSVLEGAPGAEMIALGIKPSRNRVKYNHRIIQTEDLAAANFNRENAAQMAMMKFQERHPGNWKVEVLDLLSATRPGALAYLNTLKEDQDKESRALKADTKERTGKRQSRGVVAGLSIKDLRGKASDIIGALADATPDDQAKFTTKTRLWEAPDWAALRSPEDGSKAMEPMVAAFWSEFRKLLPSSPAANIHGVNLLFAKLILSARDGADTTRTLGELDTYLDSTLRTVLKEVRDAHKEFGVRPDTLLGQKLGFDFSYQLDLCMRKAKRLSNSNTEWPASLAVTRAAGRTIEKDAFGAMPMLKSLERTGGEDYRKGLDTDEESLIATFGFSGVEYGESMTQKERTKYLNHAFDGFMDLARALNVSPQALSLGGTLGLAFGSRGRGGRRAALAHFEPSNNAINLTRLKGAGSMAHEFGHAFANYFARQVSGSPRGAGDLSEMVDAGRGYKPMQAERVGGLRKEIYDAFSVVMGTLKHKADPDKHGEIPSLTDFENHYSLMTSDFVKGAREADTDQRTGRLKKNLYWSTSAELFARAFETWVNEALKEKDQSFRNDFLVRPDKLKVWGVPHGEQKRDPGQRPRPQLYPSGEHLARVSKAFRQLFDATLESTRKVKHEHLGEIELPYLYSHDLGIERIGREDMGALAQSVISEVARMCGPDMEVRWQRELLDDAGNAVSGRFSLIEGKKGSPEKGLRGLMELSHNASLVTVYHESFHYAQEILFTESERDRLDASFARGSELHQRLVRALLIEGKSHLIEHCHDTREAQAYAYQEWVKGNLDLKVEEEPRSLFGQIRDFFGKLCGVSKEAGFNSAESLFQAFYDGRIAQRSHLYQAQQAAAKERELEDARVSEEVLLGSFPDDEEDKPSSANPDHLLKDELERRDDEIEARPR